MFPSETRVLIVDDTDTMRALLKTILTEMGFTTFYESKNGNEAFELISQKDGEHAPIGLVLADWHMPDMDGLELLKLIRSLYPDMPFVLVTTEGESKKVVSAVMAGASNYVIKPVSKAVLEEKLRAVWAKHNS